MKKKILFLFAGILCLAGVFFSCAVADALKGRVRFTSLGSSVRLKGKTAGFEVLRAEELMNNFESL